MGPTEPIGGERNPEDAAITGGAPAAAEPPPVTRGRRSSIVAPVWVYAIAGLALVITALAADMGTERAIGTAIAGAVLIGLAAFSIAGVIEAPERAVLGLAVAAVLTVLAFALAHGGTERGVYLACGAAVLIAAFATLAAGRRAAEDEPRPGVRNV
jgi:hypothetical protein